MYGELDIGYYLKELKISREEIPELVVLHGEYDIPAVLERVRSSLDVIRSPLWNILLASHAGRRIAFVGTAGAWMVGVLAHAFCKVGCRQLVQTGFFGGLQPGMRIGDVLVPSQAYPGEGTARHYLSRGIPRPHLQLTEKLLLRCRQAGLTALTGPVMSTGAMFAETRTVIMRWSRSGYVGVDSEVAATFAVANKFGIPCAAMLVHSDNVVEGGTFQSVSKTELEQEELASRRVLEIALTSLD